MSRSEYVDHAAGQVMADSDALAAFEAGLLPVPDDVAAALDSRLRRVRRGYIDADAVSLVVGMDCDG